MGRSRRHGQRSRGRSDGDGDLYSQKRRVSPTEPSPGACSSCPILSFLGRNKRAADISSIAIRTGTNLRSGNGNPLPGGRAVSGEQPMAVERVGRRSAGEVADIFDLPTVRLRGRNVLALVL